MERHVPDGFFTDAPGYDELAAQARAKGKPWRGVASYLERRAHEAKVAAEREGNAARQVIASARRIAVAAQHSIDLELL